MSDSQTDHAVVPEWIKHLGVATWVIGPERTITFMNHRAEELLQRPAADCVGQPCHEIIDGAYENGEQWCTSHCPVAKMLDKDLEVEPYTLRVENNGGANEDHWLQLLVIPFRNGNGDGYSVAHCAFNVDRTHMIESYLDRIAGRTPLEGHRARSLDDAKLSRRELEVLDLLSEDENLYSIASKLNVSYYTIRNHVQHILSKMGVHSTLEAVAQYLLWKVPPEA
jgi:DNA-binding CsgD family transcriptional regulator